MYLFSRKEHLDDRYDCSSVTLAQLLSLADVNENLTIDYKSLDSSEKDALKRIFPVIASKFSSIYVYDPEKNFDILNGDFELISNLEEKLVKKIDFPKKLSLLEERVEKLEKLLSVVESKQDEFVITEEKEPTSEKIRHEEGHLENEFVETNVQEPNQNTEEATAQRVKLMI